MLPPVGIETFRTDTADAFTPLLNQLTADEVERFDREHEREIRRKRRQTKGRGVSLPERESVRTHRTLVPRSLPGHVQVYRDERDNKHYPQPALSLPFPLVPKAVPPKPADLETNLNSPLKLVLAKDKAGGGGAGGLAATAAANRFKKAQEGPAGLESPRKVGPGKKRPQPVVPDAASLGLHEHIVDGQWFCANWCALSSPSSRPSLDHLGSPWALLPQRSTCEHRCRPSQGPDGQGQSLWDMRYVPDAA